MSCAKGTLPHQHLDHRFPAFERLHRRRAEVAVVILQGDAATKAGGPRDLVVGGALEQIEFLIPFAYGFLDAAKQEKNSRTAPGGDHRVQSRQIEPVSVSVRIPVDVGDRLTAQKEEVETQPALFAERPRDVSV